VPTDANLQSIEKYRAKAAGYDATTGRTMPIRLETIARLALKPGDAVLDVGCGTGLSFEPLARAVGPRGLVMGFEQSPEMHAQAATRAASLRAQGYRVELQLSSAEDVRLPAAPGAVLMHYVHDVLRSPPALANLLGQWPAGTRVAIAGIKFFPWWLAPLNLYAWLKNRPYNVRAHELWRPWSLIEPHLHGFERHSTQAGMGYIASGRIAAARGAAK
jgi:arsenite methyltransferase